MLEEDQNTRNECCHSSQDQNPNAILEKMDGSKCRIE